MLHHAGMILRGANKDGVKSYCLGPAYALSLCGIGRPAGTCQRQKWTESHWVIDWGWTVKMLWNPVYTMNMATTSDAHTHTNTSNQQPQQQHQRQQQWKPKQTHHIKLWSWCNMSCNFPDGYGLSLCLQSMILRSATLHTIRFTQSLELDGDAHVCVCVCVRMYLVYLHSTALNHCQTP